MKYTDLLSPKKLAIWLTIIILLVVNLVINGTDVVPILKKEKVVFQLHILKKTRDQLKLQGETEDWKILKQIELSSESMFTLTESDIESYNWPDQLITLTPESSMKLLGLGGEDFLATTKKELYLNLERALESAVFIVVLEDKKLYGGVFSNRLSTRGTQTPTIFPQIVGIISLDPLQLQIGFVMRPLFTIEAMLRGYKALETSLKSRIEIQTVHDFFLRIGKLTNDDSHNRVAPWIPKIEPAR